MFKEKKFLHWFLICFPFPLYFYFCFPLFSFLLFPSLPFPSILSIYSLFFLVMVSCMVCYGMVYSVVCCVPDTSFYWVSDNVPSLLLLLLHLPCILCFFFLSSSTNLPFFSWRLVLSIFSFSTFPLMYLFLYVRSFRKKNQVKEKREGFLSLLVLVLLESLLYSSHFISTDLICSSLVSSLCSSHFISNPAAAVTAVSSLFLIFSYSFLFFSLLFSF